MGKFRQILAELFARDMPIFSSLDKFSLNLVCALILWRSGFGIANGQISLNFEGDICWRHAHIFVSG